jgi:hypothetical protein
MFQPPSGAAPAAPQFNLPAFNQEAVRHLLIGDYGAIIDTTNRLELLGYYVGEASPQGLRIAWSEPLPTANTSAS